MGRKIIDRTGEEKLNDQGVKMRILKYNNANEIIVQFNSGYITKSKYVNFTEGIIKDLYCKAVYNHGYIGEGDYKATVDGKNTKMYAVWSSMLQRCYDKDVKHNLDSYSNCTVCEQWLNFQNFAKWFDNNYYEIEGQKMQLDKDILYKGNKIYSPDTCMFVPQEINLMFRKNCNLNYKKMKNMVNKYNGLIPDKLSEAMFNHL